MPRRSALCAATMGLAVVALVFQPDAASAAKKRSSRDKSGLSSKKSSSRSSSGKRTLALGPFSGWKAPELRDWVKEALAGTISVTDADDQKLKKPADFARVAGELGVDAVAVGRQRTGRLELTIRDADGRLIKTITVKGKRGPKLKAAIEEELPDAVKDALGVVESAPEPEPEPAPARKSRPEPEPEERFESGESSEEPAASEDESGAEEHSEDQEEEEETKAPREARTDVRGGIGAPFVVDVGARFQNRSLGYHDQLDVPSTSNMFALQDHDLKLGTLLILNLGVYANLFEDDGFISNLGLVGGFELGPSVKSKYTGTQTDVYPSELENKTREWYFGARYRIPIGANEFGLGLAYGSHAFRIAGDDDLPLDPLVLDVKYGYLRPSVDAWFSLGDLFFGADLGFRYVLGACKLADEWFPKATGLGIDAGLRVGYEFSSLISLVVGADYTRYALTLNPEKTATRVAGSAIDQYFSGYLGARFTFGSAARPSKASTEPAEPEAGAESESDSEDDSESEDDSLSDSESE